MNQPHKPDQNPQETQPQKPSTVDPDPKAHPIHPEIPMQPIHEGTDPKQPVLIPEA